MGYRSQPTSVSGFKDISVKGPSLQDKAALESGRIDLFSGHTDHHLHAQALVGQGAIDTPGTHHAVLGYVEDGALVAVPGPAQIGFGLLQAHVWIAILAAGDLAADLPARTHKRRPT